MRIKHIFVFNSLLLGWVLGTIPGSNLQQNAKGSFVNIYRISGKGREHIMFNIFKAITRARCWLYYCVSALWRRLAYSADRMRYFSSWNDQEELDKMQASRVAGLPLEGGRIMRWSWWCREQDLYLLFNGGYEFGPLKQELHFHPGWDATRTASRADVRKNELARRYFTRFVWVMAFPWPDSGNSVAYELMHNLNVGSL